MAILITGGTGYIGSHTCIELLNSGYEIVVVDDLSNSKYEVLNKIKEISGKSFAFYEANLTDKERTEHIFAEHHIDQVIHFAGYKAVGESVAEPLKYYHNNLLSSIVLCEAMAKFGCKRIVFSSSATVYGVPKQVPIVENAATWCTNPYGWTKLMIEQILKDVAAANPSWSIALLRYFNPIGAHESGLIGEDPNGIPNNLLPYTSQVAAGKLPMLKVYGDDYDTPDGTGVRDYVHVVDLAKGHVAALGYTQKHIGVEVINFGTGRGYSVLEIIKTFERVNNVKIPYQMVSRRAGDIASCWADVTKAEKLLGWKAEKSLDDMCRDAWTWQMKNSVG